MELTSQISQMVPDKQGTITEGNEGFPDAGKSLFFGASPLHLILQYSSPKLFMIPTCPWNPLARPCQDAVALIHQNTVQPFQSDLLQIQHIAELLSPESGIIVFRACLDTGCFGMGI